MLAIKNFGKEAERETGFRNRLVDACNASLRASRLSVWRQGASQLVFGLQLIVVIWLAAAAVLAGRLTIGMLVAFLAYRAMFSERCAALVDRVLEFRLARVQLDRLADIVHARPETDAVDPASRCERRATPLSLSAASVSFRYADNEPGVLRDVTLAVRPGEHVVLTGASGAGKTTLLKVLMGLLPPCGGQVLVDGVPLYRYGLQRYRREIASVMQEDRLFDGTIMDNICFFDPAPDERRAVACAQLADIAALVEAMPMRYYSLIGDMGTQLSGGQKQRLLLARALYARPRILFLDEYTSHLDALTEQRVSERLAHLSVTVVSVSHRREAIRRAGRVIEVGCAG
ncbi:MAG: ATP-binding cassette domain-containing protein [Woeseiaceae bacterium]|nr:ATP-binding cassette domain-containing protein [Woeseiaceae bacterium]